MAKTKAQLTTENNANFPNNNSQFITPEKLRGFNQDMIDSLVDEITYTADSASFDSRIDNVTIDTGSLLVTASFDNGTRNMTFTKGDSSIFDVSIPVGTAVLPSGVVSGSSQVILTDTTGNLGGNRITGSVQSSVSSSYSVTASFALNATPTDTGSLLLTASFDNGTRDLTFTKGDSSQFSVNIPDSSGSVINTGSFATTGSNTFNGDQDVNGSVTASSLRVENNTWLDGTLRVTNDARFDTHVEIVSAVPSFKLRDTSGGGFSSGYDLRVNTGSFEIYDDTHNRNVLSDIFNPSTSKHTTSLTSETIVISGSDSVTILGPLTASLQEGHIWVGNSSGIGKPTSTGSFAKTDINNTFTGTQTFNDIVVNGTGSFAYIQSVTGSAKIIGDAYIILNNNLPTERYAGLVVQDSGSGSPLTTASLEFDGQTNDWFYEYSDDGGVTADHGVVLFGPEYATKGSPTYPSSNVIQKGTGGHHLTGSSITDDGSLVTINANITANGFVGNGLVSGSSQITSSLDGRYAVLNGSNQLIGNQTITGSLLLSSSAAQQVTLKVGDGFGTGFKIDNGTNEFYTYQDQWSNVRKSDSQGIIISQTYGLDMFNGAFTKDIGFALDMNVAAGTGTSKSGIWGVGPASTYYDFISFQDSTNWTDGRVQVHRRLQVDGKLHANDGIVSSGSLDISGSILLNGSVRANVTNLAISSQTASIDFNEGTMFQLTLVSGSTTHLDATNINQGQTLNLLVIQPSSGTGSLDFAPKFLQPTGSEYTPTPSSLAQDVLTLITFVNTSNVFVANVKEFV